jgi:all-trans-retinol dehydrogenase (NAD+)
MEHWDKVKSQAIDQFKKITERYGYVKPLAAVVGTWWLLSKLLVRWGFFLKKKLNGEVVFITGGASGIGKHMALMFAQQGASVAIADLNVASAESVANQINENGGRALAVFCDVSSYDSVHEAAQTMRQRLGPPTILVNNAGIVSGLKFLQGDLARMEKTIQVNLTSHLYTLKEFLPDMIRNDHGHVVTVASIAGFIGTSGMVDYSASKFGAVGLNESLRVELKLMNSKVKTTCVCPYYINTGMFAGVSLAHQWLIPMLDEQYVARRTIQAIRQETEVLVMPFTGALSILLKGVVPAWFSDWILNFLGLSKAMETFKGRT